MEITVRGVRAYGKAWVPAFKELRGECGKSPGRQESRGYAMKGALGFSISS